MDRLNEDVARRVETIAVERGVKIVDSDERLSAYANHGRWVADCVCGGAEIVAPDRPMVCGSCGRRCQVDWPDGWQRAEALLDARPEPATRNWYPASETVDALVAENVANGVETD